MKKDKSKPISYEAITKNKKLGEFAKEGIVDKVKEVSKMTFDLVMKRTKKK